MITGIHAMFYTKHADEMRTFLRDILGLPWVDAGGNWPIFAAPPTDLAVHESSDVSGHELYFICDDIEDVLRKLAQRGIKTTAPVTDRGWGLATELQLPSGDVVGIYEPRHPRPAARKRRGRATAAKKPAVKKPAARRPAARTSSRTRAKKRRR